MRNKTDAQICECKASEQKFWRRVKRRQFVKDNDYQNISDNCTDGQRNTKH